MNEAAKREAKKKSRRKKTHPKETEGQTETWGDNKSTTNNAKFELGLVWASTLVRERIGSGSGSGCDSNAAAFGSAGAADFDLWCACAPWKVRKQWQQSNIIRLKCSGG